MKKDLGVMPAIFPMPVLMVATYDENGVVDVMNAAWGTVCETDSIALCLSEGHKTFKNILASKAFTVSLATADTVKESDFFGMVSGNKMADKFARSGFTADASSRVHAPIIREYPLTMECELAEIVKTEHFHGVIGKIVNVSAEEALLDADGKIDVAKLQAVMFDQFRFGYYTAGEKIGTAWNSGMELM